MPVRHPDTGGGITGADHVKVPDQSQSMGTGTEKQASDLIGEDAAIQWDGLDGTASGEVKNLEDFSELFGDDQKTGHFFPLAIDKQYQGKELTISGRTDGDRKVKVDSDLLLIVRIENLTPEKKVTVKDDKEAVVFTVDFTGSQLAE